MAPHALGAPKTRDQQEDSMETTNASWITVDEMKDRLSISRNHAYRIANGGSLQTVRIGRSLRINEESLTRWLDSLSESKGGGGDDVS